MEQVDGASGGFEEEAWVWGDQQGMEEGGDQRVVEGEDCQGSQDKESLGMETGVANVEAAENDEVVAS